MRSNIIDFFIFLTFNLIMLNLMEIPFTVIATIGSLSIMTALIVLLDYITKRSSYRVLFAYYVSIFIYSAYTLALSGMIISNIFIIGTLIYFFIRKNNRKIF